MNVCCVERAPADAAGRSLCSRRESALERDERNGGAPVARAGVGFVNENDGPLSATWSRTAPHDPFRRGIHRDGFPVVARLELPELRASFPAVLCRATSDPERRRA